MSQDVPCPPGAYLTQETSLSTAETVPLYVRYSWTLPFPIPSEQRDHKIVSQLLGFFLLLSNAVTVVLFTFNERASAAANEADAVPARS